MVQGVYIAQGLDRPIGQSSSHTKSIHESQKDMDHPMYPQATPEMSARRAKLAPETMEAWRNFSKQVFAEGALDEKTKQLISVAVAHVTQCPYCIHSHTKLARRKGATPEEIMEAIWVASEMRAGAALSHAALALDAMDQIDKPRPEHA